MASEAPPKTEGELKFRTRELIAKTIVTAIRWGVGGLVVWHVAPAFSGKTTVVLVDTVVQWAVAKGAPSFIFPAAFICACGWALVERKLRVSAVSRLESEATNSERQLRGKPQAGEVD